MLLAGTPAYAFDWLSLGSELKGMELFAPPEVSDYGDGVQAKTGLFVSVDELFLWTRRPNPVLIGDALATDSGGNPIISTTDTSSFTSKFSAATRLEIGHVTEENGWLFGLRKHQDQEQYFSAPGTQIGFRDLLNFDGSNVNDPNANPDPWVGPKDPARPTAAPVPYPPYGPPNYTNLTVGNRIEQWSTELLYVRRMKPLHYGGMFELYLGGRYAEINDHFMVEGNGSLYNRHTPVSPTNFTNPATYTTTDSSTFVTNASNRIVGPEIGLRFFKQKNRWMVSAEGRFMAGFNQKIYVTDAAFDTRPVSVPIPIPNSPGWLGPFPTSPFLASPDATRSVTPSTWLTGASDFSFVPLIELRAELRYRLTKTITAHVGWDGIWMNGIGRASAAANWAYPFIPIDNVQELIMTGAFVGLDLNR